MGYGTNYTGELEIIHSTSSSYCSPYGKIVRKPNISIVSNIDTTKLSQFTDNLAFSAGLGTVCYDSPDQKFKIFKTIVMYKFSTQEIYLIVNCETDKICDMAFIYEDAINLVNSMRLTKIL